MSVSSQHRCIWSGVESSRVKKVTLSTVDRIAKSTTQTFYVLPEHEEKLRRFNHNLVKYGRMFLVLIIGFCLMLPVAVLTVLAFSLPDAWVLISTGVITMLLGLTVIRFPFSTPETIQWLGIKKSIHVTRTIGLLTISLGGLMCWLA